MTTTTPTTALADLENLTRYDYVPGEAGRMIIGQDDEGGYLLRSDVLALARRAAQPNSSEFGGIAAQPVAPVQAWMPVTKQGQVRVGDKLRFTIGDKSYSQRAKQILNAGMEDEKSSTTRAATSASSRSACCPASAITKMSKCFRQSQD